MKNAHTGIHSAMSITGFAQRLALLLMLIIMAALVLTQGAALAQDAPTAPPAYPGASLDKSLSAWATERLRSTALSSREHITRALGGIKNLPRSLMQLLAPGVGAQVRIYTTGDSVDRVEAYYREQGFVNITKETSGRKYEEYSLALRPAGAREVLRQRQGADAGTMKRWKAIGARLGGRTALRVNLVRFDRDANRAVWIRLDGPYVDAKGHTVVSGTMIYIKTDEP